MSGVVTEGIVFTSRRHNDYCGRSRPSIEPLGIRIVGVCAANDNEMGCKGTTRVCRLSLTLPSGHLAFVLLVSVRSMMMTVSYMVKDV